MLHRQLETNAFDKRLKTAVNHMFKPHNITAVIFEVSHKGDSYHTDAYAYVDRFETERYPLPVDLAWEAIEAKGFKRDSNPDLCIWR